MPLATLHCIGHYNPNKVYDNNWTSSATSEHETSAQDNCYHHWNKDPRIQTAIKSLDRKIAELSNTPSVGSKQLFDTDLWSKSCQLNRELLYMMLVWFPVFDRSLLHNTTICWTLLSLNQRSLFYLWF